MKILLFGYGTMGKIIHDAIGPSDSLVGIVGNGYENRFTNVKADIVIDFSHHTKIKDIMEYVLKTKTPIVIGTTGYTGDEIKLIEQMSKEVPVLLSSNYSLGVIMMNKIIKDISPILRKTFDVEVIEKHHNKKEDAPSGTAKMLIKSIQGKDVITCINGRVGHQKRKPLNEIGVHSLRGGTIVGEHEVIYAGADELISIKHEAFSKKIFAKGALIGAKWLESQKPGLYDMEDVVFGGRE